MTHIIMAVMIGWLMFSNYTLTKAAETLIDANCKLFELLETLKKL